MEFEGNLDTLFESNNGVNIWFVGLMTLIFVIFFFGGFMLNDQISQDTGPEILEQSWYDSIGETNHSIQIACTSAGEEYWCQGYQDTYNSSFDMIWQADCENVDVKSCEASYHSISNPLMTRDLGATASEEPNRTNPN